MTTPRGTKADKVDSPRPEFLPFARPSITDAEVDGVVRVLRSGWLTTGPVTREFERIFAEYVGSRHAVAVNSATAALHLAMDALNVTQGDEVIVPTWTFAATAEVVAYSGATPVLVDVDEETLNASTETIARAMTARTKAVIVVHFAGMPLDMAALDHVAAAGVPVVEDAAHAFPSRLDSGQLAGTIGRIGAFSFYATKTITTAEGGMLVTDDDAIAERARVMSLHGISRDAWKRYSEAGSWYYEIEEPGFKYNMTDIAAALGIAQLGRADELLTERRRLAGLYRHHLDASDVRDLIDLPTMAGESHAWHLFVVRLRLDRLHIDRAAVIAGLASRRIGASVHFIPLHLHPYYRRRWSTTREQFPVATREFDRVLSLPLWPGLSDEDVLRVVDALAEILRGGRA